MMVRSFRGPSERESLSVVTLELELKRDVEAPAIARATTIEHHNDFDLTPSLCHTLVLLVSELVSNAVLHSRGPADAPILLTAGMTADAVRVTVTDAGEGFVPQPRKPGLSQRGYGLYLVDKAARRWGVDHVAGGTRVWFELPKAT